MSRNDLHQQCRLAVTHPVTLGAVALLLVNDWLLKPVWHSGWTTGKLSDFAWMVFAPPVLAFLLSLGARRGERARRFVWITAYLSLPIVYTAYNTFPSLHGAVMDGFAWLRGGGPGSPFDPLDSLVIPPAMAAAQWVWRQSAYAKDSFRTRLHVYAVVVAALSTVATSYNYPVHDAWSLGVSSNDVVVMTGAEGSGFFSFDGGLTWVRPPDIGEVVGPLTWGALTVSTPRGSYSVDGNVIYRSTETGQREAVHSLRYLTEERNFWAQAASTESIRRRAANFISDQRRMLTTAPYGIVYDPPSGHVIVGLGLLGVVVGDEHENWTPVAVGPYKPFDRSLLGRARWLFAPVYWFGAVAIPLAVIAATFALAVSVRAKPQRKWYAVLVPGRHFRLSRFLLVVVCTVIAALAVIEREWTLTVFGYVLFFGALLAGAIGFLSIVFMPFFFAISTRESPRYHGFRRVVALLLAVASILVVASYLEPFQFEPKSEFAQPFEFVVLGFGVILGLSALSMYWPSRKQLPAVAVAFVVMNAVMPLPFILWLLGGINLAVATAGSAALLAATGYAMYKHLERNDLLKEGAAAEPAPPYAD